jgi:Cu(I)/Ag(I) efflux system membrane fusion protein
MKSLKTFLAAFLVLFTGATLSAQMNDHSKMNMSQDRSKISTMPVSVKTESFKVFGKCEECKARIEKTVISEGAAKATWDIKTQILAVAFDPSKTNKDALSKKLASIGHDTEMYKATKEAYENLPSCCHYDRAE